jgi:peptidoglycan/LPS O-acetylase OafA/YrhL
MTKAHDPMPTKKGPTTRIAALDFAKGALVLLMVLYHWLNYFVASEGNFYRYLRFVTPSFIFITGFLISNVYLSRYDINDAGLAKRLAQRGVRLMAVFIGLNLIISQLVHSGQTIGDAWSSRNLSAIYLSGNTELANGKVASFYILVPISYLLLAAAGLLAVSRYKYIFLYAFGVVLSVVLGLQWYGIKIPNLEHLAIGLLGISVGYLSVGRINAMASYPYAIIAGYIAYLAAITIWNVIYPLQIVGVCLNVMIIYLLGTTGGGVWGARQAVILLGKYSLIGYIAQIVILQVLFKASHTMDLGWIGRAACLLAAAALTLFSVEVLHRMRGKSPAIDGLYRAVFA